MKRHPCFGKIKYSNLPALKKKIKKNKQNGWDSIYYYECPICLEFHLTHNKYRDEKTPNKGD